MEEHIRLRSQNTRCCVQIIYRLQIAIQKLFCVVNMHAILQLNFFLNTFQVYKLNVFCDLLQLHIPFIIKLEHSLI